MFPSIGENYFAVNYIFRVIDFCELIESKFFKYYLRIIRCTLSPNNYLANKEMLHELNDSLYKHGSDAFLPMFRFNCKVPEMNYFFDFVVIIYIEQAIKMVSARVEDDTQFITIRGAFEMSHLMGKPTICIGENKDADQLRGNREADQRLCFRYSDSAIPPLLNSKISSF